MSFQEFTCYVPECDDCGPDCWDGDENGPPHFVGANVAAAQVLADQHDWAIEKLPRRDIDWRPEAPEWQDRALCAEVDPDLFYPEVGGSGSTEEAKRVCRACPVRGECFEHAMASGEIWGIWGETSETERLELRKAEAAA